MILLFVWSIIMTKIGKKKSFLIGNLVRHFHFEKNSKNIETNFSV